MSRPRPSNGAPAVAAGPDDWADPADDAPWLGQDSPLPPPGRPAPTPHAPAAPTAPHPPPLASPLDASLHARLLSVANRVRALGLADELAVPMLVMAGNQSAGKSSVVEALAGVALPRAAGTCTRCPVELRLRTALPPKEEDADADAAPAPALVPTPTDDVAPHTRAAAITTASNNAAPAPSAPWRCRVLLQLHHNDAAGRPLPPPDRPPELLFATLADRGHIAAAVTAAQAVLLNPRRTGLARLLRGAGAAEQDGGGGGAAAGGCAGGEAEESGKGSGGGGGGGAAFWEGGLAAYVPSFTGPRPAHSAAFLALAGGGGEAGGGGGVNSGYELAFSRNAVVLEVEGAEADLTIVDLPGIIQAHPGGPRTVAGVQRMVREAIAPAHAVIVMVLTATDDPENQAILSWAREADPRGQRTLGVVTKPDRIPPGEHDKWLRLLAFAPAPAAATTAEEEEEEEQEGQREEGGTAPAAGAAAGAAARVHPPHCLALGYYAVMNPGQDRLDAGVSYAQARQEEARYFESCPPWPAALAASPPLAACLGAARLRAGLAGLLGAQLAAQLPRLRAAVRAELGAVRRAEAALPPAPSGCPRRDLQDLLRAVVAALREQLCGDGPGDGALYQRVAAAQAAFRSGLIASMPAFYTHGTLLTALSACDRGVGPGDGIDCMDVRPHLLQPEAVAAAPPPRAAVAAAAAAGRASTSVASAQLGPASGGTSLAGSSCAASWSHAIEVEAEGAEEGDGEGECGHPQSAHAAEHPAPWALPAATPASPPPPPPHPHQPHQPLPPPPSDAALRALLTGGGEAGAPLRAALAAARFPAPGCVVTLGEVVELHGRCRRRELAPFPPYRALEALLDRFKAGWQPLAEAVVDRVADEVQQAACGLVREAMARYPRAAAAASDKLIELVDEAAAAARSAVSELLAMEAAATYTANGAALSQLQAAFTALLKRAALPGGAGRLDDARVRPVLDALAALGLGGCVADADALLSCLPCPVEWELRGMAATLAYFRVVFRRLQDCVPLAIGHHLVGRLAPPRHAHGHGTHTHAVQPHPHGAGEEGAWGAGGGGGAGGSRGSDALLTELTARLLGPAAGDPAAADEVARCLLAEDPAAARMRRRLAERGRRLAEAVRLLANPLLA